MPRAGGLCVPACPWDHLLSLAPIRAARWNFARGERLSRNAWFPVGCDLSDQMHGRISHFAKFS
jgi:hypothetical protein